MALAVVLVIGVPVALAIVAATSAPTAGTAEDEEAAGAHDVEPPDPARLAGRDAALARLLRHVDASEQSMLAFQERVEQLVEGADAMGPDELLNRIRIAAEDGAEALAEVRPALVEPVDDGSVEEVRSAYVVHHDAWADYLDALTEDPTVIGGEEEGARWVLSINLSADAFARTLREEIDDDVDEAVRAYAEAILERGFDRGEVTPDA